MEENNIAHHNITFSEEEEPMAAYYDEDIIYISCIDQLRQITTQKTEKISIVCCTNGTMEVVVDDKKNILHGNDILIITPNSTISGIMRSFRAECQILCLSKNFVENFIDARDLVNTAFMLKKDPIISVPEEKTKGFSQLVSVFGITSDKDHLYYSKIIMKLVEATLLAVFGYFQKSHENDFDEIVTKMNQGEILFKKFMSMLISHKSNSRNVGYYSSELFVTPKYLSRVCKEVSGKTASQLIKEYMLKDIRLLLRFSDKSIKDICMELGFPNESFFTQYVKTNLGFTPVQYRNLSEEELSDYLKNTQTEK